MQPTSSQRESQQNVVRIKAKYENHVKRVELRHTRRYGNKIFTIRPIWVRRPSQLSTLLHTRVTRPASSKQLLPRYIPPPSPLPLLSLTASRYSPLLLLSILPTLLCSHLKASLAVKSGARQFEFLRIVVYSQHSHMSAVQTITSIAPASVISSSNTTTIMASHQPSSSNPTSSVAHSYLLGSLQQPSATVTPSKARKQAQAQKTQLAKVSSDHSSLRQTLC